MSVTQTVDIPASHRLVLDVPREVPEGRAVLIFTSPVDHRSEPEPVKERGFGCLKGQIWMADDFDAPLEDFRDYM